MLIICALLEDIIFENIACAHALGGSWLGGALVSAQLCCFSHRSLYGDDVFGSCSVAFVSRHTNPFADAQVIISPTVLAGSTVHNAACGFWFLFVLVCLVCVCV